MRALLYRRADRWRWRIQHAGTTLARSGHGYRDRDAALAQLERAMDGYNLSHYEDREWNRKAARCCTPP